MKPYVMTAGRDKRNVISEGNYLEKLVYQVAIKKFQPSVHLSFQTRH